MSDFAAVDSATDPRGLVAFLDASAVGLGAMKRYVAAAHALRRPTKPVLDLGCGVGHDLGLLVALGVSGVGVDLSSVMIETAATRARPPLVRAAGELLPFRSDAFAGCRIERVLMHVAEPEAVLIETFRCVEPEGLVTIFEPDWSSLFLDGASNPWAGWLSAARHPAIGRDLGALLMAVAFTVVDRVEERSWWSFEEFERITNLQRSLDRAIATGKISEIDARHWIAEQRERAAAGVFRAEIAKVLWVAKKTA
jgi:ubiquinone/menaquinone biosynthesis C-methylase UbiE